MVEITLVRHGQASFGAADYDVLSELGHQQSRALGAALKAQGLSPQAVFVGAQRRHSETLAGIAGGMGVGLEPVSVHAGLNEFDFSGLLEARFRDRPRPQVSPGDRAAYFRMLRDTVLAWQRDEVADPPESWAQFVSRVETARQAMCAIGAERVLAVSSGGAISQMVAAALATPSDRMIQLQLQMKNCAVTRLICGGGSVFLHGFNETPHIDAATSSRLLTYS